jgi:hypothetical protein
MNLVVLAAIAAVMIIVAWGYSPLLRWVVRAIASIMTVFAFAAAIGYGYTWILFR